MANVTAQEQLMLELLNRARLDPEGEANRFGIDVTDGLPGGAVTLGPKQPLAMNPMLVAAARGHSQWMLDVDVFSHTGAGGSAANQRMAGAGYVFTGSNGWGENLAWGGVSPGPVDLTQSIFDHHQGLFLSPGHRRNILDDDYREIGVGQREGLFFDEAVNWTASMLTQKFAYSGTARFVTGVAYNDSVDDDFYGVGEGVGSVSVSAGAARTSTAAAGGYELALAAGQHAVQIGAVTVALTLGGENIKLDVVNGSEVWTNASIRLQSAATMVTLLGVADSDVVGWSGTDILRGNLGANFLDGVDGNDSVFGNAGNDTLVGGIGADTLFGEADNDLLFGFFGQDLLWGGSGNDTLRGERDNDVLLGEAGNDLLDGGDENDTLYGFTGQDTLLGGQGADLLFGEADNDLAYGWLGSDTLWGGAGNDTLFGEQDNDVLLGETGNDVLLGQDGNDSLYGWTGDDTLYGFTGNDLLLGEDGQDVMLGEDGADFLGGQAGNDWLVGGRGADTLWGDGGDDTFVFAAADLQAGIRDVVNSFGETTGNFDRLRFEGIAPGAVTVTQQGADTLITFGGTTASVLVTNFAGTALADQIIYV
jgi:Ca2+-binding RTX toxin-like protein